MLTVHFSDFYTSQPAKPRFFKVEHITTSTLRYRKAGSPNLSLYGSTFSMEATIFQDHFAWLKSTFIAFVFPTKKTEFVSYCPELSKAIGWVNQRYSLCVSWPAIQATRF